MNSLGLQLAYGPRGLPIYGRQDVASNFHCPGRHLGMYKGAKGRDLLFMHQCKSNCCAHVYTDSIYTKVICLYNGLYSLVSDLLNNIQFQTRALVLS